MNQDNILGTNLTSINYYSPQQPFLNEFKSSQSWITQSSQKWNTKEQQLLDLDADGWVKSLPDEAEAPEYTKVGSLLFRDHNNYPAGNYVVLYEGEGEIEYKFDAKKNEALSSPGRDVIEVNPSKKGIFLSITETDPNATGDYIRNIRVVPESYESVATTQTFNPEFLEKIQPFGTLRFMDWMETNNSDQMNWIDRPTLEDARYSNVGVPVEVMVELANETDTNPWFTIPHQATDEYVTNFATYVKNNLESDLEVYVEYSNEVWNGNFEQTQWAVAQAKQEWPDSNLNHIDWYSKRTTEVVQIWDQTFGGDKERVFGVMAAQAANYGVGKRALDYNWSDTDLSHSDTGIDAIAIAPYFGRYIGKPENKSQLESWTKEADGGLNKLFTEINQGGLLSNSPEGGALAEAFKNMDAYANIADQEGLQLLAYEGGQHLAGIGPLVNNQAVTDLFIAANRDSRMGEVYQDYLEGWSERGGDFFAHYNDISVPSKWGSWGSLESVYQDSSPKYDALIDFVQKNSSSNQVVGEVDNKTSNQSVGGVNNNTSNQTIGEVGRVSQFDHQGQTIKFERSYVNPVVFASPLSHNGGDPATVRITDIQNDSFTAFLQEPEYKDVFHVWEDFSYMVVEAGSWQLADGAILEVGLVDSNQVTSTGWENISFSNTFNNTPVVLSQVQTMNDEQFVRTRQKNATVDGFSLSMEEEEALRPSGHGTETVGWLAIEPGQGASGDLTYQASHTNDDITHRWHSVEFGQQFTDSPHVFASIASFDGSDSAGLRYQNLNSELVQIQIEEEQSRDSEIGHTSEIVDFLAISGDGVLIASEVDSSTLI